MNYTVVSKSGWVGDTWRVAKTFTDKDAADKYAASKKNADPKSDWYQVKVVSHAKPLASYVSDDTYRINGTVCVR